MGRMTIMTSLDSKTPSIIKKTLRSEDESATPNRNIIRGVWELARLHTKESWLCWYPAMWAACLSAGSNDTSLDIFQFSKILFANWISITVTHCAFCTFNDICDRNLDLHVARCKIRPLPAGMISLAGAVTAFVVWMFVTLGITYKTMGSLGVVSFVPIWILSAIYPFMKRLIPFPQVLLGLIIGGAVLPGWVSVSNSLQDLDETIPLFLATATWVVYFDVFYATQDSADDKKIGVKSLAVMLGNDVGAFLSYLGLAQVIFFSVTAVRANMSAIFWLFGVGVWTISIPYHILALDLADRKSGGRVFKANIMLGLFFTIVAIVELCVTRVLGWHNEDYLHMLRTLIRAGRLSISS